MRSRLGFYAAVGASDVGAITPTTLLAQGETDKIRAAFESIPADRRKRHMNSFANSLFTRLSGVNASVKFRYLKAGFEIVGDHPQAKPAREVYDYYMDLNTEIELLTTIDGDDKVGTEPFGVAVAIRHTAAIERESGGFAKYLQNQNNSPYSFNYGRPTENYRDKFDEANRKVLKEQFEVLSVTFNDAKATSMGDPKTGWRKTPYAYLLLKARGPEVDRLPPLQIDLDFLDTSGYVSLPVASEALPLDASVEQSPRPFDALEITQVLDERKAKDRELIVEIRAKAHGLIPELEQLVTLDPEEFDVVSTGAQDVSVTSFTDDQRGVISERIWNVKLTAKEGAKAAPKSFTFPAPILEDSTVLYQRYLDADLIEATPEVSLEGDYVEQPFPWLLVILGGIGLLAVILLIFLWSRRPRRERAQGLSMPEQVTPFTVLGLLRQIERKNGLSEKRKRQLTESIVSIERYYYAPDEVRTQLQQPDISDIAQNWVKRAG